MKGSRRVGSFRGGGGGGGGGAPQPPTDLLVCFPTRSHLTLMPKPICSPSRANNAKSSPRPAHLFRTPTNTNPNRTRSQLGSVPMSEPTSPKVTCAGQIKVRSNKSRATPNPNPNPNPKHNHNWIESLGLKKDVTNFLGALRSLRFNMQCFGSFHRAVDCCSDEEEEAEEEEDEDEGEASRPQAGTVFSKWFMVLEENNDGDDDNEDVEHEKAYREEEEKEEEEAAATTAVPPKNALLLTRCRSAPTKGLEVEEKEEEEGNKGGDEERLMLMSYAPDFYKLSTEVAKETWVVGSVDPLARSRSWRR